MRTALGVPKRSPTQVLSSHYVPTTPWTNGHTHVELLAALGDSDLKNIVKHDQIIQFHSSYGDSDITERAELQFFILALRNPARGLYDNRTFWISFYSAVSSAQAMIFY